MIPLDVGRGAREILAEPARGRVVSVHRKAAYLRFPAGLLALTTGGAPRGPLHVRVATLPALEPGDAVRSDGAVLAGARWSVPLPAATWVGALPPGELLAGLGGGGPRCDVLGLDGLRALAAELGGRGPGLTPAGDDVLAGVLLVTRALWGEAAEPDLLAVADSVVTTDVAAAFLAWAARGQCIEPAHDWLGAVARRDEARATRAAVHLTGVGASSGGALLDGLRLGLAALPAERKPPPLSSVGQHTVRLR